MHSAAQQTQFQRRDHVNNFGRSERVAGGDDWTRLVDVELDAQGAWSVVVNTAQITSDGPGGTISSRVLARVEQGSGNGFTKTILDATDVLVIPVAGDHCLVDVKLVSAFNYAGTAAGIAALAAAPSSAAALVSAFLASDLSLQPSPVPAGPTFTVTPTFGAQAPSGTSTATAGLVSKAPVRVVGWSVTNPAASGVAFFALVSTSTLPNGTSQFPAMQVLDCVAVPAGTTVRATYAGSRPAPAGLAWLSSTALDPVALGSQALRVDLELVRQPTVAVMSAIQPTG